MRGAKSGLIRKVCDATSWPGWPGCVTVRQSLRVVGLKEQCGTPEQTLFLWTLVPHILTAGGDVSFQTLAGMNRQGAVGSQLEITSQSARTALFCANIDF